ncbi:hypothetical protein ACFRFU_19930 [Streptomyces sp. NPDC056704]|uniref:hypothetical protein n=1 Tax=Streptomyces sp. NPDC056704 TaxID=3345917 RepID=UPI0036B36431
MDDQRYHLTLTLNGEVAMQGWWGSEAVARRQFATWIGERGSMPGVHIVLVDELEARVLASWPAAEGRPVVSGRP